MAPAEAHGYAVLAVSGDYLLVLDANARWLRYAMDHPETIEVRDIGPDNSPDAGKGLGCLLEHGLMDANNYQPTVVDPSDSPPDDCE